MDGVLFDYEREQERDQLMIESLRQKVEQQQLMIEELKDRLQAAQMTIGLLRKQLVDEMVYTAQLSEALES
jgi:hypothetical protein